MLYSDPFEVESNTERVANGDAPIKPEVYASASGGNLTLREICTELHKSMYDRCTVFCVDHTRLSNTFQIASLPVQPGDSLLLKDKWFGYTGITIDAMRAHLSSLLGYYGNSIYAVEVHGDDQVWRVCDFQRIVNILWIHIKPE